VTVHAATPAQLDTARAKLNAGGISITTRTGDDGVTHLYPSRRLGIDAEVKVLREILAITNACQFHPAE
jgi:hypothetical protein